MGDYIIELVGGPHCGRRLAMEFEPHQKMYFGPAGFQPYAAPVARTGLFAHRQPSSGVRSTYQHTGRRHEEARVYAYAGEVPE